MAFGRLTQWFYSTNSTTLPADEEKVSLLSATHSSDYSSVSINVAPESGGVISVFEIPDSKGMLEAATRSSHIRARLHQADNRITQILTSRTAFVLAVTGVFAGITGLGLAIQFDGETENKNFNSIWDPYRDHPCPADSNTFSTLPEVFYDAPNDPVGDEIRYFFYPHQYCEANANEKINFEVSQSLSAECLFLLKNSCANEESASELDNLSDEITVMEIVLLLALVGGMGYCVRQAVMNVTQAAAQIEEETLVQQGMISTDEAKTVVQRLYEQNEIQQTYKYLKSVRDMVSRDFFPTCANAATAIFDYLVRDLDFFIKHALSTLRCEPFQIRVTNKHSLVSHMLFSAVASSSNHHASKDKYKLPGAITNTLLSYVDFEECGIVKLSLPEEKEAIKSLSTVASLDEDDQESPLNEEQLFEKVQLAIALSSIVENAFYVRVDYLKDKYLFYFNKARNELIKLNISQEQVVEFDRISQPANVISMLTVEQLANIIDVTKHDIYVNFDNSGDASCSVPKFK